MARSDLVSIIIPTFNSQKDIGELLRGIRRTNLPNYEIIVVDDKSTDETTALCRKHNVDMLIELDRQGGPARARNIGAARARGEIIIFVDSDVTFHDEVDIFLGIFEQFASHDEIDCICTISDVQPAIPNAIAYNNSIYHHYYIRKMLGDRKQIQGRIMFFSTRLGGIRRERFRTSGGFQESLPGVMNEDGEFWTRLYHKGYQTLVDGSLIHIHRYPTNLMRFIRSYFLSSMVQFFIDRKMDTSADKSISKAEKARRIYAFIILFSPAAMLFIQPLIFLAILCLELLLFLLSFGEMNRLVLREVPGKHLVSWYLCYLLITPFILLGYLHGGIKFTLGHRILNDIPSSLDFFTTPSKSE